MTEKSSQSIENKSLMEVFLQNQKQDTGLTISPESRLPHQCQWDIPV